MWPALPASWLTRPPARLARCESMGGGRAHAPASLGARRGCWVFFCGRMGCWCGCRKGECCNPEAQHLLRPCCAHALARRLFMRTRSTPASTAGVRADDLPDHHAAARAARDGGGGQPGGHGRGAGGCSLCRSRRHPPATGALRVMGAVRQGPGVLRACRETEPKAASVLSALQAPPQHPAAPHLTLP